jgi:hypothetical protein
MKQFLQIYEFLAQGDKGLDYSILSENEVSSIQKNRITIS